MDSDTKLRYLQKVASCLIAISREERVLQAARSVIGRALNESMLPGGVPAEVKRYAKYHKVRMDEVHAVLKRLADEQGFTL